MLTQSVSGTADCKWMHSCTGYCHATCGNGIHEAGEECDFGVANGSPGCRCSSTCHWVKSECGNGITEYPEECDEGELNGAPGSLCE